MTPIVVTASLPRFMSPGDSARMLLEVVHASGPEGDVGLTLGASGVFLETDSIPAQFQMTEGSTTRPARPGYSWCRGSGRHQRHPYDARWQNLDENRLSCRSGDSIRKSPRRSRFALAAGDTFRFDREVFTGFAPGSGSATLRCRSPSRGSMRRGYWPRSIAIPMAAPSRSHRARCRCSTSTKSPPRWVWSGATSCSTPHRTGCSRGSEQSSQQRGVRSLATCVRRLLAGRLRHRFPVACAKSWMSMFRKSRYTTALDNLRNRINFAPDFDRGGEGYRLCSLCPRPRRRGGNRRSALLCG